MAPQGKSCSDAICLVLAVSCILMIKGILKQFLIKNILIIWMTSFWLHNYFNSFRVSLWAKFFMTASKSISTRVSGSMLRSARLVSPRYVLISNNLLNDLSQDDTDTPTVSKIRSTTVRFANPSPYFSVSERSSGAVSDILLFTRNFRSCTSWQSLDGEMSFLLLLFLLHIKKKSW